MRMLVLTLLTFKKVNLIFGHPVLIWMHFSCWIQMWWWKFEFWKNLKMSNCCLLLKPARRGWSQQCNQWASPGSKKTPKKPTWNKTQGSFGLEKFQHVINVCTSQKLLHVNIPYYGDIMCTSPDWNVHAKTLPHDNRVQGSYGIDEIQLQIIIDIKKAALCYLFHMGLLQDIHKIWHTCAV